MNAIRVGISGRVAMLKAIFGADETEGTPAQPAVSKRLMTPELFNAIFQGG